MLVMKCCSISQRSLGPVFKKSVSLESAESPMYVIYVAKNNAGLGLTYSSRMMRRLRGDMYIVSYDGLVHVSPADITSRRLSYTWPGTFVYISLDLSKTPAISLEQLLAEVRDRAMTEVTTAETAEETESQSWQ